MGQPHKHRDVIIAWANGEDVQYRDAGKWYDFIGQSPSFAHYEWRIKPKSVKREGWVNVHRDNDVIWIGAQIYTSKEEANLSAGQSSIACTRIEWEEEV